MPKGQKKDRSIIDLEIQRNNQDVGSIKIKSEANKDINLDLKGLADRIEKGKQKGINLKEKGFFEKIYDKISIPDKEENEIKQKR